MPASGAGGRDQADIAQLLRALNDDLRDDPPEGGGYAAEPDVRPPPRRAVAGRPSVIAVGVAVVAAAAIGLGSMLFTGAPSAPSSAPGLIVAGGRSAGEETPPPLIARAAGEAAAAAESPAAASPPVLSPSQIAPSLGPAPRLLTPGQTATVVRPVPEPAAADSAAGGATVVVQPLAPQTSAQAPAAAAAAPRPAPAVAKPSAAAKPAAPAPQTPAPQTPAAAPGGPGRWAVQVGTFSVAGNAEQLVRRLGQNGRQAYVVEWQDRQGRTWKAVRVGNFTGEAAARAAVGELKTQMDLTGQLIDLR